MFAISAKQIIINRHPQNAIKSKTIWAILQLMLYDLRGDINEFVMGVRLGTLFPQDTQDRGLVAGSDCPDMYFLLS